MSETMHGEPRRITYGDRRCGDVTAVRLEAHDGNFVTVCGCGWRSSGAERVAGAVVAWQEHRDTLR